MVIPILGHWVAVQVTISSFRLEIFPGQTFFSSQLRYGPCCLQINNARTSEVVRDTVQRVVDSYCRPVSWDYSSSQCCILDSPASTDIEECILVAKSRFQAYASLAGDPSSTTGSLAQGRSTVALRLTHGQFATETPPSQCTSTSIDTCNAPESSNPACLALPTSTTTLKRRFGDAGQTEEFAATLPSKSKHRRTSKEEREEKDAKLAQNTTAWLGGGVERLSAQDFPKLVALSDIASSQPQEEAHGCADYLWRCAEEMENSSVALVWSLRFIAACASLIGTKIASSTLVGSSQPVESCRHTLHHWRCSTEVINSIVKGMLPSWGSEALLIYHVLAARGNNLSSVGRLSEARRNGFVSRVIEELKKLPAPNRIEGVSLFNPAKILCGLLSHESYESICRAAERRQDLVIHSKNF